jgi:hypothetical protein
MKSLDYRCEDRKNVEVKRPILCHLKGLDPLFQKTPKVTFERQTFQPGAAFEDKAFKLGV